MVPVMSNRRRITALVMSLLLAHLAWVGSGFACDMTTMAHSGSDAIAAMDMSDDMAGMDMTGMDMAGMDMSGTTKPLSGSESEHHHAPCDFPWAPEGCQSMAPCAPIALAAVTELFARPDAKQSSVAALGVLTPPSIKRPPELPPPRA